MLVLVFAFPCVFTAGAFTLTLGETLKLKVDLSIILGAKLVLILLRTSSKF